MRLRRKAQNLGAFSPPLSPLRPLANLPSFCPSAQKHHPHLQSYLFSNTSTKVTLRFLANSGRFDLLPCPPSEDPSSSCVLLPFDLSLPVASSLALPFLCPWSPVALRCLECFLSLGMTWNTIIYLSPAYQVCSRYGPVSATILCSVTPYSCDLRGFPLWGSPPACILPFSRFCYFFRS